MSQAIFTKNSSLPQVTTILTREAMAGLLALAWAWGLGSEQAICLIFNAFHSKNRRFQALEGRF